MMPLCSRYGYNPITQTFTSKAINSLRNYSNGALLKALCLHMTKKWEDLSLKNQVTQTEVVIMEGY